jgi:hypothetical protein
MSKQTDLINIPDAITVSGSNVGIGTSSPNRNLHVSGGAGDVAFGITNAATGTASSDGFSITVENPTPDVAIRQRENNNMKFLTNNTERMRILSGGGITFNGDTAAANALNDYEEGTFTPIITVFSGTNPTLSYGRQQGVYIKVGDLVYVSMIIDVNSASNLGSGFLQIGPLPFAIRSGEEAEGVSNTSSITPARGNHVSTGCHSIVQTQMGFLTSNNGAGWSWETTSIMPTSACAFRISTTYRV